MLPVVEGGSDGYAPRARREPGADGHVPLTAPGPDTAVDGGLSAIFDDCRRIDHQTDYGGDAHGSAGAAIAGGAGWNAYVMQWDKLSANLQEIPGTFATPSGATTGAYHNFGVLLLRDGRVVICPFNGTSLYLYDPQSDSLVASSTVWPGGGAFVSAVELLDGRVFFVPYSTTTARIWDPQTDTLFTPAGTYPGSTAYWGGLLLDDGRVFMAPFNHTTAAIYDPETNSVVTQGSYPGSNAFGGSVKLPDGRIVMAPGGTTQYNLRIYDPVTDASSQSVYSGDAGLGVGVFRDGRVMMTSSLSQYPRIIDPLGVQSFADAAAYALGGVVLPDGKAFVMPIGTTAPRTWDAVSGATTVVTLATGSLALASEALRGAVILKDGRIFMGPYNGTTARIVTMYAPIDIPDGWLYSSHRGSI